MNQPRLFRLCRNIAARVLHDTLPTTPSASIPVRQLDDLIRAAEEAGTFGAKQAQAVVHGVGPRMITSDETRVLDPTQFYLSAVG